MRKVLFVHDGPLYTTEKGEVYGTHYSEKIKQRYLQLGDQVTFCMRNRSLKEEDTKRFNKIFSENFSFTPFPNFKNFKNYIFNKPKAKRIITDLVKENDLVVIRMPSASGSIAIKAARKYNIPYLVEMVSCTFDALWHYDWRGKLLAPYKLWKIKKLIKDCPYVIYVTKKFLQKRYPNNGISIHCSNVELSEDSKNILSKRLNKIKNGKHPVTLGSIGVLDVKYKGQADVIRALHQLKREGLIFHYNIVGQGQPKRLLYLIKKFQLEKEVKVIGSLPSSKINEFLLNIDLYIQPSRTEGLPRALIEAMSMACPSLGSKVGGIPELLNDDSLFNPGSVREIKTAIKSFSKDKMLREAERNYEFSKRFQKEVLEERRKNFYKRFLSDYQFR